MSKKKILTGAERESAIQDAGAKLAVKYGQKNVTRKMVAEASGVSAALVSHYMGGNEQAQKAYARRAIKLGLKLPDKAAAEALGKKLRAHKPKDARDARKRSPREVKAIKDKAPPVLRNPGKPIGTWTGVKDGVATGVINKEGASGMGLVDDRAHKSNPKAAGREVKPKTAPNSPRQPAPPETKTAARAPKAPPPFLTGSFP